MADGTADLQDSVGTTLVITQRYKHLGGVVDATGRLAPELRRRAGAAYDGYHKVKQELVDPSLPEKVRLLPIATHVLSTLLYNAATWPRATEREEAIIARPYYKSLRAVFLRRLDGTPQDASDLRCRLALRMPSLRSLLRQKRLVYLRRVALHAPAPLRALLQHAEHDQQLYPCIVLEDLQWMAALLSLPPADTFASGIAWTATFSKKGWARAIAKAINIEVDMQIAEIAGHAPAAPGANLSDDDDAPPGAPGPQPGDTLALPTGGEGTIVRRTSSACKVDMDGSTHWITLSALGNPHLMHLCIDCNATFATPAALASHRHRRHGIKNTLRLFFSGTCCQACMLEFHSRERLLYHLKQARSCRDFVLLQPPLTEEEAEQLDHVARTEQRDNRRRGLQPRHAQLAAFRLPGPLPLHAVVRQREPDA